MMCMSEDRDIRLYVNTPLREWVSVFLDKSKTHYLCNVMRLKVGDRVRLFNGLDGEWYAKLVVVTNRCAELFVEEIVHLQCVHDTGKVALCFALVKSSSTLHNIVRFAVEMGVSSIQPLATRYTVAERINVSKLQRNIIEATEQCERLDIPEISDVIELRQLRKFVLGYDFVVCDADGIAPSVALERKRSVAVIVGPEGGFSGEELTWLREFSSIMSLGSRILRVDSAVAAALAYINEHRMYS